MDSNHIQNPPALFSTFVMSLASAAMIELGLIDDPMTKKKRDNPQAAKQHIDILEMIQEKTKGNLEADEKTLLEKMLADIKLQYVKKLNDQET